MEDNAIVDLYWSRSEEAIVQTEKAYGPYCRQVAWNILRSAQDAEECVNDTWLRAWNAMPTHRPASLRAFLGKVTRNLSLDRWEKAHAEKRGGGRNGCWRTGPFPPPLPGGCGSRVPSTGWPSSAGISTPIP